jgi:amino acid transporter
MTAPRDPRPNTPRRGKLGTFAGVFTPSILTILGIILFLRLGFVVGAAGLRDAILILGFATLISALTSVSLSAIVTNRKVRGGGDYYLISRSLGVAYGGALGFVLFLAQSVSVAFYCAGFGEAVTAAFAQGDATLQQGAAFATIGVLLVVAYAGADVATRLQFVIMAVLVAALASFFGGALSRFDGGQLAANWPPPESTPGFWVLYALFFPAVTGFTQGVSMSGDLKDPARSLPLGTFSAVGLSTLIYLGAAVAFAANAPASVLAADYQAMRRLGAVDWLIDVGVMGATASSALASFLGAPRILQALASDRVFPALAPFAVVHGTPGNPRRGVLLTAAIAAGTLSLGNLNAIAALVSMFFLISYALLNYATYVEATGASPSFRPRFRFFDARASLVGTLACLGAMAAIDPAASVIALAVLAALYQYARRTAVPHPWRDSWHAYRFRRMKEGLLEIAERREEERDWQPHILVFTDDTERRPRLLRFAGWMAGGSGIIAVVRLVEGDGTRVETQRQCAEVETAIRAELAREDLDAFPLVVAASDLGVAASATVQAWGVGPIRANTILLNWVEHVGFSTPAAPTWAYARMLRRAILLHRHVVVLDADAPEFTRLEQLGPDARRIDVWWRDDPSSRLALLLAYLMTRTDFWEDATIRLLVPAPAGEEEAAIALLRKRLEEIRIDAECEAVPGADSARLTRLAHESAMMFLPLRLAGTRLLDPFGTAIESLLPELPIVALVGASGDVALGEEEASPPAASSSA